MRLGTLVALSGLSLGVAGQAGAAAGVTAPAAPGFATVAPAPASGPGAAWEARSPLAMAAQPAVTLEAAAPRLQLFGRRARATPAATPDAEPPRLSAERARTLLRSIVFPGWGQAALGHRTSGTIFALAETGVWASFASFRIQQQMRRDSYERTARIYAGIDLSGRDEEFRRIVGAYESNEDYNRLVVYRDAANLYYDDPVKYREYIATHELKAADSWNWSSDQSFHDYRGLRKDAQRAALRANAALAMAVVNRLVCTLHAARLGSHAEAVGKSWNLEMAPAPGGDATAFRLALSRRF